MDRDVAKDLKILWKHTVKRDLDRGCFVIGRMEVRNSGDQDFPAGRQGMIKAWRVNSGGTPEGKETVLIDSHVLPAIPAGKMIPIGPLSASLFEDMKASKDSWQFAFYIRGMDGKSDTKIYQSEAHKIADLPRVDDLEKELESLRKELDKTKTEYHRVRIDLERTIGNLSGDLKEKDHELRIAEGNLRESNRDYNSLTDECRRLRKNIAELESKRREQSGENLKLNSELESAKSGINKLTKERKELQQSLSEAENELSVRIEELDREKSRGASADGLSDEVEALKKRCTILAGEKNQLKRTLESAKQKLGKSQERCESLEEQLKAEREKNEEAIDEENPKLEIVEDESDRQREQIPEPLINTIIGKDGAEMVLIPAGEFQMGSKNGNSSEKPVHTVYLDAFYMDKYPVTNALYKKFMEANGYKAPEYGINSNFDVPDMPVVGISWEDAGAYAKWAEKRLPTEAEWEKAARGGLEGREYPWGDNITKKDANYGNKLRTTSLVGSYDPNGYGLYDIAGNVCEWCVDWYDSDYYSNSPKSNPKGPSSGDVRVLRGGSWNFNPSYLRVSYRLYFTPTSRNLTFGFRCISQD